MARGRKAGRGLFSRKLDGVKHMSRFGFESLVSDSKVSFRIRKSRFRIRNSIRISRATPRDPPPKPTRPHATPRDPMRPWRSDPQDPGLYIYHQGLRGFPWGYKDPIRAPGPFSPGISRVILPAPGFSNPGFDRPRPQGWPSTRYGEILPAGGRGFDSRKPSPSLLYIEGPPEGVY